MSNYFTPEADEQQGFKSSGPAADSFVDVPSFLVGPSYESNRLQQFGEDLSMNKQKRKSAEAYLHALRDHIQLSNPYKGAYATEILRKDEIQKFWGRILELKDDPGVNIDWSKLPPHAFQIDEENRKRQAKAQEDLARASLKTSDYPITSFLSQAAGGMGAYLDPSSNPLAIPTLAVEFYLTMGASSLFRTVGKEVAAAGVSTLIETPHRKFLKENIGERYGTSEFFSDFLAAAAISSSIPIGLEGLKRLNRSNLAKLARTKVRGASTLADELFIQARAFEFADSPFNLRNDLSLAERFNKTIESVKKTASAFEQNRALEPEELGFTSDELRKIVDADPEKLTIEERRIQSQAREVFESGGDAVKSKDVESGFVDEITENGVTVRTADGELLPVDLTGRQLDNIVGSQVKPGSPVNFKRASRVTDGQVEEVADVVPLGDTGPGAIPGQASDSVDNTLGRQAEAVNESGFEYSPGGTVNEEVYGVHPSGPELEIQNKIFDEVNNKEYLDSLFNEIDLIEKDFEVVLGDGSITTAKDVVTGLKIKNRKIDGISFCGVNE